MRKTLPAIIFIALALVSCNNWKEKKLHGKWKAASVTEDGMPLPTDISTLAFEFYPGGLYQYTGNLNYREAGIFSVKSDFLYTLDTINEASSEKMVKILSLSKDSMTLKMNEEGHERLMKLAKSN